MQRNDRYAAFLFVLDGIAQKSLPFLHVAAVFAANAIQGSGYLAQRTRLDGFHEFLKYVAAFSRDLLQSRQCLAVRLRMFCLESPEVTNLVIFLAFRGANELELVHFVLLPFLRQERIHTYQRQRTVMLLAFVVKALILNLASLIHGVHS